MSKHPQQESPADLRWYYNIEQRYVIPVKWLLWFFLFAVVLMERPLLFDIRIYIVLFVFLFFANLVFTMAFWGRLVEVKRVRGISYLSIGIDVAVVGTLTLLVPNPETNLFLAYIILYARSTALFCPASHKNLIDLTITVIFLSSAGLAFYRNQLTFLEILTSRIAAIAVIGLLGGLLIQVFQSQQNRIKSISNRVQIQSAQNQAVLAAMHDAVMVFDRSLQLCLINPSAETLLREILGPSPSRLDSLRLFQAASDNPEPPYLFSADSAETDGGAQSLQGTIWDGIPPEDISPELEKMLEEVRFRREHEIAAQALTVRTKIGTTIRLVAYARLLQFGPQEDNAWLVLMRDTSELRAMEEQLITSEKMAEVGRLAAGMAHELGNPITTIQSAASYLQSKTPRDSPLWEEAEVIEQEARRCGNLLSQLLKLASRDELCLEELDLIELLQNVIRLTSYQCPEQVQVIFNPQISQATIRTDPNLLTQALLNLVMNAIQSIVNDGTVEIRLTTDSDSGWMIEVADNGVGMSPDKAKRIFEPFYTTRAQGTGLGLSITQRIISRLEGTIHLSSIPNRGTCFTLTLPTETGSKHSPQELANG